jgi:hypothetical protein
MAHMYPKHISPDTQSEAERRLYQAFAEALPADYTVFHSARWLVRDVRRGAHDGEADFVVAHPQHGILVVEAKGGLIRYDGAHGQWYSNKNEINDPFIQAERNKYSLLEMIKASPGLRDRWIPVGHAVAFPDCVVDRHLRLDAPREIILDATDLPRIREWVEQTYAFYAPHGRPAGSLGLEGVRTLIDILSPSIELKKPLGAAIARESQAIIRLTEEQFHLLTLLRHQRRAAISGCAGSGKTMLALEQARRLSEQGFRVLLTCFNAPLAESLLSQRHAGATYDVVHFHGLCRDMAGRAGLAIRQPRVPNDTLYYDELLPEALLDAAGKLGPQYDAVIVDEGQDFQSHWWIALQALLHDRERGVFYVFYDDNQNLYQTERSLPADLMRYALHRNCRNTQEIHRTFLPFYRSETVPEAMGPQGRRPQVIFYRTDLRLKQLLGKVVQQLVGKERVPATDIIILTPRSAERSQLARWETIGNWRLTTQAPPPPGHLRYESIYRFKGLESPVVILAEFRPAQMQDADTLLYVGCSRARNHLVILAHEGLPEEVKARLLGRTTET